MCILHSPHISIFLPLFQRLNSHCAGQRRPIGLVAAGVSYTRDSSVTESRAPPAPDGPWLSVGQVRVPLFPSQGSSVDMSTCCVCISESRAVGSVMVGRKALAAGVGAGEMAAAPPPSRLRGKSPSGLCHAKKEC